MIKRYVVSGHSMEPSFYDGDRLIVSSLFFNLRKGDVVIFNSNGMDYIKRIKSVAGKGIYVAAGDNTEHSRIYTIARKQIKGKLLIKF